MRIALAWVDLADPTDRVVAENLGRELRRLGHDVRFVGPRRGLELHSRQGIPTHLIGHPWLRRFPRLNDAWGALQLLHLHSGQRIDLWHCHVFGRSHRAFRWAARLGRLPSLVTLHLVLKDYLPFAGGKEGLKKLLAGAVRVTAVSEANRKELLKLFPDMAPRSSVVYSYGADAAPQGPLRKSERPYILCPARLAPYKGVDVLLMAFALIQKQAPKLDLVVCGRDQMNGELQRFAKTLGIEDRVTLTGELHRTELQALLRGALFAVLPSRRDNFPIALIEAMAAGKAVVATRVGGVPEMVRHGVDGLLAAPGDVERLAAALKRLAKDPAERRRMELSAKERAGEFSWQKAAAGYAGLYASCRG